MEKVRKNIGKIGIGAIMLMSSLTVMVGNAITPAIPEIGRVYNMGSFASWLVTAPALGVVVTAIFFGKMIDKKGPYVIALGGLLCYGVFGVLGAFMPNVMLLFIDRFLLGAATAAIMSASYALIAGFFKGEKQLKIMALQGMSMEFGGVIFLSISGFLANSTWQGPFFIYGFAFLALIMLVTSVPKKCLYLSSEEENGGLPEKPVPIPLILLAAFLGMLMFFTAMVSLPMYLQDSLGRTPAFTGYYLAGLDLVAALAGGLMPQVVKRVGVRGCLTCAFTCYGLAFLLYWISAAPVALVLAAMFVGLGMGLSTPLFSNLVLNNSVPEKKGQNASFCTMAMFAGQFMSALLVSLLSSMTLFITSFVIAVVVGIGVFVIGGRYIVKKKAL